MWNRERRTTSQLKVEGRIIQRADEKTEWGGCVCNWNSCIPAKKNSRKTNTTLWIKLIKNSTMVAGKTVGFIIASALGERMDQLK